MLQPFGRARSPVGPFGSRPTEPAGQGRSATTDGLRVLVVDSDIAGRDQLTAVLSANPAVGPIWSAADAVAALRLLHTAVADIAFVDVHLPGLNGLDFARVLRQFANPPVVVFVAADGHRAAEAFDVGAIDYVLRPVVAERVGESLRRIGRYPRPVAPLAQPEPAFMKTEPAHVSVLPAVSGLTPASVRWVEVRRDLVRVYTTNGTRLLNVPLGQLVVNWAAAGIVRIHRSYAVQLAAVSEFRKSGKAFSVMVDGRELPVSRRCARLVKDRLAGGATDLRNQTTRAALRRDIVAA